MDDRTLLEAAAKAAGIHLRFLMGKVPFIDGPGRIGEWNPLTEDGDALRLAVKLNIETIPQKTWIWAVHPSQMNVIKEPPGADPYAATRRAIVRAAAAIAQKEG